MSLCVQNSKSITSVVAETSVAEQMIILSIPELHVAAVEDFAVKVNK